MRKRYWVCEKQRCGSLEVLCTYQTPDVWITPHPHQLFNWVFQVSKQLIIKCHKQLKLNDGSPTPLNVSSTSHVDNRIWLVIPASLLILIHSTRLWRVSPRLVVLINMIPKSGKRLILCLRSTEHWTGRTVPLGMSDSRDGHVRVYWALHVFLLFGAVVILVALPKLAACIW